MFYPIIGSNTNIIGFAVAEEELFGFDAGLAEELESFGKGLLKSLEIRIFLGIELVFVEIGEASNVEARERGLGRVKSDVDTSIDTHGGFEIAHPDREAICDKSAVTDGVIYFFLGEIGKVGEGVIV